MIFEIPLTAKHGGLPSAKTKEKLSDIFSGLRVKNLKSFQDQTRPDAMAVGEGLVASVRYAIPRMMRQRTKELADSIDYKIEETSDGWDITVGSTSPYAAALTAGAVWRPKSKSWRIPTSTEAGLRYIKRGDKIIGPEQLATYMGPGKHLIRIPASGLTNPAAGVEAEVFVRSKINQPQKRYRKRNPTRYELTHVYTYMSETAMEKPRPFVYQGVDTYMRNTKKNLAYITAHWYKFCVESFSSAAVKRKLGL